LIKLINKTTGTDMWVADSRLAEYLAQGHRLAPAPGGKPEKATPSEMAAVRRAGKKKTG
jgi:hypothetical protein